MISVTWRKSSSSTRSQKRRRTLKTPLASTAADLAQPVTGTRAHSVGRYVGADTAASLLRRLALVKTYFFNHISPPTLPQIDFREMPCVRRDAGPAKVPYGLATGARAHCVGVCVCLCVWQLMCVAVVYLRLRAHFHPRPCPRSIFMKYLVRDVLLAQQQPHTILRQARELARSAGTSAPIRPCHCRVESHLKI